MEFKVGDKVVGNSYNWSHRVGENGTIERIDEDGPWVRWSNGDFLLAKKGGIDLVSRATPQKTTPPRKMHPDDFVLAVCEFATDNGFGVTQLYFDGTKFGGNALPHHSYSV